MTDTNMCSNFGSKWYSPPPPHLLPFEFYVHLLYHIICLGTVGQGADGLDYKEAVELLQRAAGKVRASVIRISSGNSGEEFSKGYYHFCTCGHPEEECFRILSAIVTYSEDKSVSICAVSGWDLTMSIAMQREVKVMTCKGTMGTFCIVPCDAF